MAETRFCGRRILLVEDNALLADALSEYLTVLGAVMIGPARSVKDALRRIEIERPIEAAIVDADLGGQFSVSVVEQLRALGIPVLLATGYDSAALPEKLKSLPRCQKPQDFVHFLDQLGELLHE